MSAVNYKDSTLLTKHPRYIILSTKMEGKAVLIFLGFVSCVFAEYSMKPKCDKQCLSDRGCGLGYYCKTVGCNSFCRPVDVIGPLDRVPIDSIIPGGKGDSFIGGGSLDRIIPGGSVDRITLGRKGDSIIPGGSLDRIIPGGSVHNLIPDGSVGRVIRGDSARRIIQGGSLDRIMSGGSVDRIFPKGCIDTCFSRKQCNFNEDCQNRNGCNKCVRVNSYT
ncbi:Hypothetical predicted protein [Mytilus galloprovincialis]|uniref:Uncharacterized protein n=1 Tax=Mytilus galloprovincialis TaxID=29158 RepID=A0A8B6DJA7_MYTGA|nr:Hypothetical predicted protein [Mytilus galloprovincialis]